MIEENDKGEKVVKTIKTTSTGKTSTVKHKHDYDDKKKPLKRES